MLSAGRLTLKLVIEERVAGQDAAGQPSTTWQTVCTTRAEARAPTGMALAERVLGGQEVSPTPYSLRIRWRTGISAGMRARHGTTVFDIAQVVPDLMNREYVDLVVHTGASEG